MDIFIEFWPLARYSDLQKELEQSGGTKFLYFLDFLKFFFRDYFMFILTRLSAKNIRTFD